jgi:hypothetical protein
VQDQLAKVVPLDGPMMLMVGSWRSNEQAFHSISFNSTIGTSAQQEMQLRNARAHEIPPEKRRAHVCRVSHRKDRRPRRSIRTPTSAASSRTRPFVVAPDHGTRGENERRDGLLKQ